MLHTFSTSRLTTDSLCFTNGWLICTSIADFHRQVKCHTRHTKKRGTKSVPLLVIHIELVSKFPIEIKCFVDNNIDNIAIILNTYCIIHKSKSFLTSSYACLARTSNCYFRSTISKSLINFNIRSITNFDLVVSSVRVEYIYISIVCFDCLEICKVCTLCYSNSLIHRSVVINRSIYNIVY